MIITLCLRKYSSANRFLNKMSPKVLIVTAVAVAIIHYLMPVVMLVEQEFCQNLSLTSSESSTFVYGHSYSQVHSGNWYGIKHMLKNCPI